MLISQANYTFIMQNDDKIGSIVDLIAKKRGKKQLNHAKYVILQIFEDSRT
jgi:CHASE3 domain sensor protein